MMRVRDFLDEVEIVPDDSGLYEVCDEVKELYNNFHENLGIDKKFIKSNIIDDIINTVNSKEKEKAREYRSEEEEGGHHIAKAPSARAHHYQIDWK